MHTYLITIYKCVCDIRKFFKTTKKSSLSNKRLYINSRFTCSGILDNAVKSGLCIRVVVNVALRLGSSKQGKAFLASTGSNLDVAMALQIHLPQ